MIAASWTPTATPYPTNVPDSQMIMSRLNTEPIKDAFTISIDQLEDTIGASYRFLNVEFLPPNAVVTEFRVDVRCMCGRKNAQCCTRERGFVYTMVKMKPYIDDIVSQIPQTVKYMSVVTFDQTNPLPGMSADWEDVKGFLYGRMDGNQFGFQVTPRSIP